MNLNISKIIYKFDNYILFLVKSRLKNKYLDFIMPFITSLGNLGAVWIMIAIALLIDKPYRTIGSMALITLIISTIIGEGIVKHIVKRIRPCDLKNKIDLLIEKPMSYSFPSGHTLSSFAVASILSVNITRYRVAFIAIALLIALSRIYLIVHYPTDIIAGIVLGLMCSKLILVAFQQGYFQKFETLFKNIT
jgi:undecaprenyl-diphosphatase